jgi:hypothetical protein
MKPDHLIQPKPANAIVRAVRLALRLVYSLLSWALKDGGSGNICL